jgi:YQGE family putative transporter
MPIFVLAGWLSKKYSRKLTLILGGLFQLLFYLTIYLLKEQAINHIGLLATLYGTGSGFYWLAVNVLSVDHTTARNRDWFNGVNGMCNSLSQMIGPFVAGWIVTWLPDNSGYSIIFFSSFLIFCCSMIFTFFLPAYPVENTFHWSALRSIYQQIEWRHLTYAFSTNAFRNGVISFAINVWVFMETKNEGMLGNFSFLTTLMSLLMFYWIGKFGRDQYRWRYMYIGNILFSFALFILLLFKVSWLTLLLYGMISALCNPLFDVPFHTLALNTISYFDQAGKLRIELVVARELALSVGRISSVAGLYLIYSSGKVDTYFTPFFTLLIFIGLLPHLFLHKMKKKV